MEIRRHAASALVLASFLAFNTATSKSPAPGSSSSSSSATTTGTLSSISDIDPAALRKSLGCATKTTNEACRVLTEFEGADPLTALPASGRDVWYGESFAIGLSADGTRDPFFLQLERHASGGLRGSARSLIPENASEKADAIALLMAVKRGAPAPKGSLAVDFMRTAVPPQGAHDAKPTTGKSTALVDPSGPRAYLRQKGDRILIIESGSGPLIHMKSGLSASAWCSELWQVK